MNWALEPTPVKKPRLVEPANVVTKIGGTLQVVAPCGGAKNVAGQVTSGTALPEMGHAYPAGHNTGNEALAGQENPVFRAHTHGHGKTHLGCGQCLVQRTRGTHMTHDKPPQ